MLVVNRTPYTCERVILFDRNGAETLLVAIKALYNFAQDTTRLANEQEPITVADEYYGEPGFSSVRLTSDLLPPKKSTDILLTGHAIAPKAGVKALEIGVRVGDIMQKAVVFGERRGFGELGSPRPFEQIPLVWENAFGGSDKTPEDESDHGHNSSNPVGRGFFAKKSKIPADEILLPNIEHATERLRSPGDAPTPVGFSPLAPSWSPRLEFAGTYDEAWINERAPLLPDDFDDQFLQTASRPLVAPDYLQGNELCALLGVVPEGKISFPLQTMRPFLRTRFAKSGIRSTPNLETVHIDADARTVSLLWKSAINIHGRVEEFRELEVRLDQ